MLKTTCMVVVAALFSSGPAPKSATIAPVTARAAQVQSVSGESMAPLPWAPKDPADSLYREARAALGKGDYAKAAELFRRISRQYPSSAYASESLYYLAFSEYRLGGPDRLRSALASLTTLQDQFPSAAKAGDAKTLRTRVCGELARQGDEACAAEVSSLAAAAAALAAAGPAISEVSHSAAAIGAALGAAGSSSSMRSRASSLPPGCPSENDDDDERVAALNALLQMDAERAMPILTKVLERRDPCSVGLRRKAVFLLSQKRTPETADILLRIARNDPDQEVREQAVFWLSQVPDERAVTMLQQILTSSGSDDLKEKALFALSQQHNGNAAQFLRDFAARENEPEELRGQAVFWLGQRRTPENAEFLRSLYARVKSDDVKEKILFSLSQQRDVGNDKWLLDIARNKNENIDLRKKALFFAGQGAASSEQLISLYSQLPDAEMREQLIFVYSQRHEPAVMDKLFDIAKNDRDPDLRKKAIFWLGQSHDPRVQQFLLDIISK